MEVNNKPDSWVVWLLLRNMVWRRPWCYANGNWRDSANLSQYVHELTRGELRMQVRLHGINVELNLGFGEDSVCL